jgi:hypothetical protein
MKKKLDLFNFFYSLGAVIILLGVIAKLLEWEGQDILMTVGLSMEIFIFALSAVKFVPKNDITSIKSEVTLSASFDVALNVPFLIVL